MTDKVPMWNLDECNAYLEILVHIIRLAQNSSQASYHAQWLVPNNFP